MHNFQYRTKNHLKIAQLVTVFSFVLGFVDAATYLLQQQQMQQQYLSNSSDCSKVTLTMSSGFSLQIFRLFSNLGINIVTLLVHAVMYAKIRIMTIDNMNEDSRRNFRQVGNKLHQLSIAST